MWIGLGSISWRWVGLGWVVFAQPFLIAVGWIE